MTEKTESFVVQLGKTGELTLEHDATINQASTVLQNPIGKTLKANSNFVARGQQISKRWEEVKKKNVDLGGKLKTIFTQGTLEAAYREKKYRKPNETRTRQIQLIDQELKAINNAPNKTPAEKNELVRGCLLKHKQTLSKEHFSTLKKILQEKLDLLPGKTNETDAIVDYGEFKRNLANSASAAVAPIHEPPTTQQPLPTAVVAPKEKAESPLRTIVSDYATGQLVADYSQNLGKKPPLAAGFLNMFNRKLIEGTETPSIITSTQNTLKAILVQCDTDEKLQAKLPTIRGYLLTQIDSAKDSSKEVLIALLTKPEMGMAQDKNDKAAYKLYQSEAAQAARTRPPSVPN